MEPLIRKLDFVAVPSTGAERSRTFYVDTLGLRPDDRARYEFWAGQTCFVIWEPEKSGLRFAPQTTAHPAFHVEDVAAAKVALEDEGIAFFGDVIDTGVCHMALFADPDGNGLMLHHRYKPRA